MSGLCAGIRIVSGRLSEVQSRINLRECLEVGGAAATCTITLTSSGNSLSLTSAVALQVANTCSIESVVSRRRSQAGERCGWSFASLLLVR